MKQIVTTATPETAPVEVLTQALIQQIGMSNEDAQEIAGFVIGAFNGTDEVDDMALTPDLRSIFYTLEGHRFLTFRRDERTNENGEVRRHFHWQFRWDVILESSTLTEREAPADQTVYEGLPGDAWARAVS